MAAQCAVVRRVSRRVEGYENVGHDATATIDGATLDQGLVHLGRIQVDAVETS